MRWAKEELIYLEKNYANTPMNELRAKLKRTEPSIYNQARLLGLRKSEHYISSEAAGRLLPGHQKGKQTQFKPGNVPHNKGQKGWRSGGNSATTQFKPGHRPHTWVPVGSERKTKEGYLQRKVSDTGYPPRDWINVHHIVWVKHNGPIPAGHVVIFINGDKMDFNIDNLKLISMAENMRRNTIHNLPGALADACRTLGVLNRHINGRTKNEK